MKTLKYITILLLSLCLTDVAVSQNQYTPPFTEKEIKLLETGKETVLKYGPGYYKKTHTVKIESGISKEDQNRIFYRVKFLYNKNEELLEEDFAAMVIIWADTGRATSVMFGNNRGYDDLDTEKVDRNPHRPMPYSQRKRYR